MNPIEQTIDRLAEIAKNVCRLTDMKKMLQKADISEDARAEGLELLPDLDSFVKGELDRLRLVIQSEQAMAGESIILGMCSGLHDFFGKVIKAEGSMNDCSMTSSLRRASRWNTNAD